MNEKQQAIIEKVFAVNEHFSIRRSDYEGMPNPMLAWTWSDERMTELAARINQELARYDANDPEGMEDDFWKTMEDEAVRMGMEYYEDFDDDYCAELQYKWMQVK